MSTITLASNAITYNDDVFHTSEVVPVFAVPVTEWINSSTGWTPVVHYKIVIRFTAPGVLWFWLKDITNQPTWTDDAPGAIIAVDDIRAVLPVPGGGGGGGGVANVTASAPLASSGGATPNITHGNTAVVPAAYGNGTGLSATFSVDAKGHVTEAYDQNIAIPSTQINDSSTIGRSMLTAADAAAERALLGPPNEHRAFLGLPNEYTAVLNQTGEDAPVATGVKNQLVGTPVWAYLSQGQYTLTITGAFPAGRTKGFITGDMSSSAGLLGVVRIDDDTMAITTTDNLGNPGNDVLNNSSFMIRVDPA